ncbi:hypothetical protein IKG12_01925, partial [Candidatus Saccharibacteria bacterium]|nr:hypothetical protein [Candidatus Saccharibacteria bacterium]
MGIIKQPIRSRYGLSFKQREESGLRITTKQGGLNKFLVGVIPIFAVAFMTAFAVASVFAPTQISDATSSTTTITADLNNSGYYIKIWSDPSVDLELMAGPNSPMSVAETTVKTFTNSPSGYKLYLGMTSSNTSLVLENESNAIPSLGVLPTAATPLGVNTWGYAVNGTSTGVPSSWSGTRTTGNTIAANSETYAGVPAYGSEGDGLLQSTNQANGAGGTDEQDYAQATPVGVYYAVRADANMPSGKYSNTVAYTALAEASSTGDFGIVKTTPASYNRPKRYEEMGGTTNQRLTIDTTVFTSMNDLGTATVTLKGGPISTDNTASGEQMTYTCANPTVETVSNLVRVSCDLPLAYAGKYIATLTLNKFGLSTTFDYYYYVDWGTISAMQEMGYGPGSLDTNATTKVSVCETATNPVGDQPFYLPNNVTRTDGRNSSATAEVWTPSTTKVANSVPEIYLKDLRDYTFSTKAGSQTGGGEIQAGYYRIRKLADGECWMTENMDHPHQTGHYYFAWDTDMNTMAKWAPTSDFIDGTNPGDSVIGYKDTNYNNDHTYYGNGCNNTWGTDGNGGSDVVCTASGDTHSAGGRYVQTADGET